MTMVEIDADAMSVIMQAVTPAGWVMRLVCRSFATASINGTHRVTAKSVDSVERLEMARLLKGWVEPLDLCSWSAHNGHLEVLKWAWANGCPWNEWTCAHAAMNGHLEVLKWARANGCPWDWWTCANAASYGRLEVLKWARSNGCPWNVWTCQWAAMNGHLEVLKWALANGCPQ
jgi:hypothetical protein